MLLSKGKNKPQRDMTIQTLRFKLPYNPYLTQHTKKSEWEDPSRERCKKTKTFFSESKAENHVDFGGGSQTLMTTQLKKKKWWKEEENQEAETKGHKTLTTSEKLDLFGRPKWGKWCKRLKLWEEVQSPVYCGVVSFVWLKRGKLMFMKFVGCVLSVKRESTYRVKGGRRGRSDVKYEWSFGVIRRHGSRPLQLILSPSFLSSSAIVVFFFFVQTFFFFFFLVKRYKG